MKKKYHCQLCNYLNNLTVFLILLFSLFLSNCSTTPQKESGKVIVEAYINKHFYKELREMFFIKDETQIHYLPFPNPHLNSFRKYVSGKIIDNKVRWTIDTDDPILVSPPFGVPIIMNPGDSVHILYLREYPEYSGKNIILLSLLDTLMLEDKRIVEPRKRLPYSVASLEDYLEWNQFINDKLAKQIPIIESFKDKISLVEYEYYKAKIIGQLESDRVDAFIAVHDLVQHGYPNLTRSDLVQIWDSTQAKISRKWLESLSLYNGSINDLYSFLRMEIRRKYNFDFTNDSLRIKSIYTQALYNNAKQKYKEQTRERLMVYILDEPTITEMGLKNPTTQAMLKDYYSQPGYPEYKLWVKKLEKERQKREIEKDKKRRGKLVKASLN